MTDLVAFLRARLDIDAQVAREATAADWRNASTSRHYEDVAGPSEAVFTALPDTGLTVVARTGARGDRAAMVNAEHIARHDPARVLAEVDAKRRIIAEHRGSGVTCPRCSLGAEDGQVVYWRDPCATLRLLALPYADHPEYRPEWAPET